MFDINSPSAPSNGASPEYASRRVDITSPDVPQYWEPHTDSTSLSHEKHAGFPWVEAALGCLVLFLFITLIDIGYVVNSNTYRDDLAHLQYGHWAQNACLVIMFGLSYTTSNVALLCCLSAFLGALGERTGIMGRVKKHDAAYWHDGLRQYMAAVLRGIFVFLVLMSGMLVLGAANFTSPTQAAYGNLAGAASLFSFLIGRDPKMFSKIVERVNRLEFEKEDSNAANALPPGTPAATLDKDKITTEMKRTEEHVHAEACATAVVNPISSSPTKP